MTLKNLSLRERLGGDLPVRAFANDQIPMTNAQDFIAPNWSLVIGAWSFQLPHPLDCSRPLPKGEVGGRKLVNGYNARRSELRFCGPLNYGRFNFSYAPV
jgi:hypothetical protein